MSENDISIFTEIEGRMTWLLRAHDLAGWTKIPFTQDTISKLLAVKRPSVSMAMSELHRQNVVSYSRGKIRLADRERLGQRACECFRTLRARRHEILGHDGDMRFPVLQDRKSVV